MKVYYCSLISVIYIGIDIVIWQNGRITNISVGGVEEKRISYYDTLVLNLGNTPRNTTAISKQDSLYNFNNLIIKYEDTTNKCSSYNKYNILYIHSLYNPHHGKNIKYTSTMYKSNGRYARAANYQYQMPVPNVRNRNK